MNILFFVGNEILNIAHSTPPEVDGGRIVVFCSEISLRLKRINFRPYKNKTGSESQGVTDLNVIELKTSF